MSGTRRCTARQANRTAWTFGVQAAYEIICIDKWLWFVEATCRLNDDDAARECKRRSGQNATAFSGAAENSSLRRCPRRRSSGVHVLVTPQQFALNLGN